MESRLWIRHAEAGEQSALEALQWRASLANEGDREALLAHPDAIQVPLEQIEAKQIFVAILRNSIIGFAAILDRNDGEIELDGLFVEPDIWKSGTGRSLIARCARYAREHNAQVLQSSAIHTLKVSTSRADLVGPEPKRHDLAPAY